ncbi:hypothetical protein TGAM01_v208952 [Trichoderma gamsii]|uniref:Uncharacterized protein n=1 Tax=Trichoderma gamsii TaxID=398673 RepID=A0A2P4ZDD7_9HYPO|nr:hypothetical protein TGAM01_v208952 [Trichoderma gamsii]PON22271.1 hypothetical protein TGAM01_v208952 [Trichoderma gamsii]
MRGCGRKVSLGYQMNEANCALDQCTFVTTYMHNMNSVTKKVILQLAQLNYSRFSLLLPRIVH